MARAISVKKESRIKSSVDVVMPRHYTSFVLHFHRLFGRPAFRSFYNDWFDEHAVLRV